MAEAIISRRGSSSDMELRTEIITGNVNWTAPKTLKNNIISVRIFGGGGYYGANLGAWCGGGGWMNNGEITIIPGQVIPVTIGRWSAANNSTVRDITGGTTSFGTYLSANGGGGRSGSSGVNGIGYQFGGGGGDGTNIGGYNGGMWGGGGGGSIRLGEGGNGGMYGGGGGGSVTDESRYLDGTRGGNGGTYGGGGGAGGSVYIYSSGSRIYSNNCGIGGTYGGNGGTANTPAENGTNTIGITSVPANLRGNGISGTVGCTKRIIKGNNTSINVTVYFDGGGGYGGIGGHGGKGSVTYRNNYAFNVFFGGGGGGGYGGRGGNGGIGYSANDDTYTGGGGGGGYGGNGGDGNGRTGGGGGGYFSDAIGIAGGGYYNYCRAYVNAYPNGASIPDSIYGYGSGVHDGACIIQYWI